MTAEKSNGEDPSATGWLLSCLEQKKPLHYRPLALKTWISALIAQQQEGDTLRGSYHHTQEQPGSGLPAKYWSLVTLVLVGAELCSRYTVSLTQLSSVNCHLYTNADKDGVRGVAVHIRESLNSMKPERPKMDVVSEVVPVEIKLSQNDRLLLMALYRSPNSTVENNDKVNRLVQDCYTWGHSHILLVGDFNYPDVKWNDGVASHVHLPVRLVNS